VIIGGHKSHLFCHYRIEGAFEVKYYSFVSSPKDRKQSAWQ
jgi:hypothetical protein